MTTKRLPLAMCSLLLLGAAGAAQAGVSATVTAVNDYDFRGITQSAGDPALQASIDFAADNGFYVGAWASNVDFGDEVDVDVEVDLYAGFAKSTEGGLGWDLGLVYYSYPSESDFNFFEAYGSVSYQWFKGKLWFSPDFGGDATEGDTEAWYIEANANIPLPEGFAIPIHAGYSGGDYWEDVEYFDWSVGVTKSLGHFNLALKFIDGSDLEILDGTPDDVFTSESRVVFSIATTFPWSNE